ncbi:hypothetical protein UFOVP1199_20 [uncultured Caudovirales phage]|uniref:Uncharacterized protein n=1 Tax=uncultured Caudovirales phage TaxID=2100421 RepID=A0A6J5R1M4_9CAUD|nr:hypothetical protein UFOVP1137_6 [uncultured Caudovirales phage]CAB4189872.1 hypothetical protein UFOVP1199_20 [uncultured Caudovirales phage]CAB4194295.1 hypothetical protein UFOVP1257_23 [uncultured Caudovirales phage]CAB4217189.1 hypothetical protein UFOVP1498_17 [uncultured Caudovirales phage]CAB5230905.1 hypothetical protein UFOVP1587_5 [uncultured Caudovirales phage]
MYIAELVQSQLLAVSGLTKVAADLRVAGDVLPVIVYEVESDDTVDMITGGEIAWKGIVRITCISTSLTAAIGLADAVRIGVHQQTWASTYATCYMCTVTDQKNNLIDDGAPGLLDVSRSVTLTLQIFYKDN